VIVVILGATGVGKTKLSLSLAKKLNAEIINADAMQVYKRLDIGTAKIKDYEGIPHHLIDFVDPNDNYNIYNYQKDCRKIIDKLLSENKNIIIVGGSGLYIKSALYNYEFHEEENKYNFDNLTNEELLNKIKEYDQNTSIHINNRKRLERTLTKYLNNATTTNKKHEKVYDFITIGLTTDRELLYQKIDKRVDQMVEEGLIEEVKQLYDENIHSQVIQTAIGYKELYEYFCGKISKRDAIDLIKKNSRHYAKRQYTFFNHQLEVKWFNTNYDDFNITVEEVFDYIKEI